MPLHGDPNLIRNYSYFRDSHCTAKRINNFAIFLKEKRFLANFIALQINISKHFSYLCFGFDCRIYKSMPMIYGTVHVSIKPLVLFVSILAPYESLSVRLRLAEARLRRGISLLLVVFGFAKIPA